MVCGPSTKRDMDDAVGKYVGSILIPFGLPFGPKYHVGNGDPNGFAP